MESSLEDFLLGCLSNVIYLPVWFTQKIVNGQASLSIIINPDKYILIIPLAAIVVLIVCSLLVSGAEAAYFSIQPNKLKELKLKRNISKQEKLILKFLGNPKKLLAAILIANNLINIAIVIIAAYVTIQVFDFTDNPILGFTVEVVVLSIVLLLFGEVLPKIYAVQNSLQFAKFMAYPILVLQKVFYPITYLLVSSTAIIDKKLRQKKHQVSVEDLSHAFDMTDTAQTSSEEKDLLKGIVHFGTTSVKQIMTSRTDIMALDKKVKYDELLRRYKEIGFSRIPIYENNLDKIVGIVYIKDLLLYINEKENFNWYPFIRQPYFVPESKKIDDLLNEFQTRKNHIAVVVDEYGGCSGIVTLEDILEEIVGEIHDEFDEQKNIYSKIDDNTYIFDGKTPLKDLCRILNINLNTFIHKGDADTLGGLVVEIAGRIPAINEKVTYKSIDFFTEAADKRRVKKVKVCIIKRSVE